MTKSERKELNALLHELLRLRDKSCLRCGNPEFQLSHVKPKGKYRKLEFDSKNILALCFSCHLGWWHKDVTEAGEWFEEKYPERYKYLLLRSQASGQGTRNYKLLKVFISEEIKKYGTITHK